jgi:hypothetical protein
MLVSKDTFKETERCKGPRILATLGHKPSKFSYEVLWTPFAVTISTDLISGLEENMDSFINCIKVPFFGKTAFDDV